eukprot:gene7016-7085_t
MVRSQPAGVSNHGVCNPSFILRQAQEYGEGTSGGGRRVKNFVEFILSASFFDVAGCAVQPPAQLGLGNQVNIAPPGRAMAWLPPQAGQVVSVLEERRVNGVVQDIVLSGDANMRGENKISITALTGSDLPAKYSMNQVDIAPASEPNISAEMEEALPDMNMGVGETLERNAYGPFGYAVGTSGKVGCMYAWQVIGRSDRASLIPNGLSNNNVQPASVRVRICQTGTNPMALVTLMRQFSYSAGGAGLMASAPMMSANDALGAANMNPYGASYGAGYADNGLAQSNSGYNRMQPANYTTATAELPLAAPSKPARPKRTVQVAHNKTRLTMASNVSAKPVRQPNINIPLPDDGTTKAALTPSKAIYRQPTVAAQIAMESSDQSQKSMLSTVALIGFGLLFAAGLILWHDPQLLLMEFAMRRLLPLTLLLLGGLAVVAASLWVMQPASTSHTSAIGGPFTLIDQNGKAFTDQAFKGKISIVFFGYTHCPDVCPTTLYDLSQVLAKLPDTAPIAVAFVTVDPERDTPASLKDYLSSFDPRIVGLSGSREQITPMTIPHLFTLWIAPAIFLRR